MHDDSRLLLDLASLGVTVARGPDGLAGRVLTDAAADLAAQLGARSFALILAGFDGVAAGNAAPAGARSCAGLSEALDLLAANAVAVRRWLDEAGPSKAGTGEAGPGEAGRGEAGTVAPPVTVLVSRAAPSPAELKLLVDLVADPGGAAALLPACSAHPPPSVRVLELSPGPAGPDAFSARLRALPRAAPQPAGAGRAELRIGVLGALTINDQPAALLPAQSQLIVALALHGDAGLSNGQLCDLLGSDPGHRRPSDSLRQLIVRTRRQLGRAGDGLEWIEHRGGGRYALHRTATVDWTEFEAITSRAIAARDAGQLAAAMSMVRGEPFTGCYYWWLDLALVERVRARITDAADTLGKLELASGRPAQAARAARGGLVADEAAERLWRVLMRAEHAAGNMAGVREAWSRCLRAVADISADGQPESATVAVYEQLVGR